MILIDKINSSAFQDFSLIEPESGSKIFVSLRYLPFQRRWMMDVTFGDFTANGIAVLNGVNLLRNYRNIINFGFTVVTTDGFDPAYILDFEAQRAQMYLLDSADVASAEAFINEV